MYYNHELNAYVIDAYALCNIHKPKSLVGLIYVHGKDGCYQICLDEKEKEAISVILLGDRNLSPLERLKLAEAKKNQQDKAEEISSNLNIVAKI